NVRAQVPKFWIHLANQCKLLLPPPTLDLLFPRNGMTNVTESLKVNEPRDVIPLCKSANRLSFVLNHPALQIVCHSRVQHSARAAQNVDVVHAHCREFWHERPAVVITVALIGRAYSHHI